MTYLLGGGLVTQQGIAAQKEFDRLVVNVEKEIISSLKNGVVFTPSSLVDSYNGKLSGHVRQALWALMNKNIIELTFERKLRLNPSFEDGK